MKRIFWGLVKIALLVGVLVLGARYMMSEDFNSMVEDQPATEMENLEELDIEAISSEAPREEEAEVEKVAQLIVRNAKPVTAQQKTYVNYSERAGMPEVFSEDFTVMGSEALSSQIARMVGESEGNWGDLSVHKKTFWVISELALRGLNVDSALSVSGAKIEISNGELSVDMTSVNANSAPVVLPSAGMSYGGSTVAVTPVQEDAPVMKKSRRGMGRIDWNAVVEAGQK